MEAIIGRDILRVGIIDMGLGVQGLRFGHPGRRPGLYPPEVWRVNLPKAHSLELGCDRRRDEFRMAQFLEGGNAQPAVAAARGSLLDDFRV